ncbi:MAG: glycosyltransferase [Proteobacteria bacterium]|nr:glycosyltransferase [Pseudomonadota bacterium]
MNRPTARNLITEAARPAVSVIIPAFNRKDELQELLAALARQTLAPEQFEIIVVDDGSTDDTLFYLKSLVDSGRENLIFHYQKNQGPGAARNRGMAMARGDVFAFTDTDCRPHPDWLEELLKPFADRHVGAVGGAEQYDAQGTILQQAIHICMTSSFTTGGLRGATGTKLAQYYPRTFNMAISRDAFEKTGGFKSLYHGEDIELSFRIKQAGFALVFNERAKVQHRRRDTIKGFVKQVLKMGEARVTLARLHPELLEPLHVVPAAGLLALLLMLALSLISNAFFILLKLLLVFAFLFLLLVGAAGSWTGAAPVRDRMRLLFLVPVFFILQQSAYGIGFYRGLWKWLRESVNR